MIAVVGYANTDVLARVPALPGPGERVQADSLRHLPGGMGANAAAAAARFGAEVAFFGVIGEDEAGHMLADTLADAGVDTSHATRTDHTTTAIILVDPEGQRAIVSEDDALGSAELRRALALLADTEGLLYLDGYRWPWALDELRDRPTGVRVAVDLDGLADAAVLPGLAEAADHLLVSAGTLATLTGAPPEGAASELTAHGATVVVTEGPGGWALYQPGAERFRGTVPPVSAVDTTGAGDVFCGAYLAGLDAGEAPVDAAWLAGGAAAHATTAAGAHGAPTSRSEARALLAAHGCPAPETPLARRKS